MQILHRYSGAMLFESETAVSTAECVALAVRSGANLRSANLSGADLRGADLSGATYGEGVPLTRPPVALSSFDLWGGILVLDRHVKIGCQLHPTSAWREFDDAAIAAMDCRNALKWWRTHKDVVLAIAAAHCDPETQAEPA